MGHVNNHRAANHLLAVTAECLFPAAAGERAHGFLFVYIDQLLRLQQLLEALQLREHSSRSASIHSVHGCPTFVDPALLECDSCRGSAAHDKCEPLQLVKTTTMTIVNDDDSE